MNLVFFVFITSIKKTLFMKCYLLSAKNPVFSSDLENYCMKIEKFYILHCLTEDRLYR